MSGGPTQQVGEAERREIEAFVFHEARLADTSQYGEWEALVTEDMHYWVPAGPALGDPAAGLSYINDNRARLATRIRQLQTGKRHSQTPASPMCRAVTNVEARRAGDGSGGDGGDGGDGGGDEYVVTATQVVYELAVQSTARLQLWPGRVTYRLRRVDGMLRMAAKTVELVTASEPQPNLTFLL